MEHDTSIGTSRGQSNEKSYQKTFESQVSLFSTPVLLNKIVLDEEDEEEEEEEESSQKQQRARFTLEEDKLMIQAWLNISKAVVVGVNQKTNSFWSRIKDNYNEYRGHLQAREALQLKARWQKLNKIVQKFVECYKQAYQRKKSGDSETDIMQDAYTIYFQHEHKSFKLEYAWRLLKDEPKWSNTSIEGARKRTKIFASGGYSSSSNPEIPSSCECNPTLLSIHPMGIEEAKRKGKSKANETSYVNLTTKEGAQSLKISVMENMARAMHESNKLKDRELKMKEKKFDFQILFKDTSTMTVTQLQDHERLCTKIREKYELV